MRELLRRHRVACFLAITFAVSWSAWLLAGRAETGVFSPLYLIGLLGPLVGAIVTTAIVDGRDGVEGLLGRMLRVRVGLRWWAVAIGLPLAVAAVGYVIVVAYSMFLLAPVTLPSVRAFGQFVGYPATNVLALAVMLIAINGFGEETGWRGFLLPTLERRWSPLRASLIVGGVWALWHVPAFAVNASYRAMPLAMLPIFFIGIVCGSLVLAWLYHRGRGSIALVAVWHGLFDLMSGTVAARGALAAIETTTVIVIALVLVSREVFAIELDRHGHHGHHVLSR